eukprot:TRINITY_DN79989_c0_g1_i1.p1 TRINITY_DN79989_c0_g1~~TRINITY_DN79989_c0_g1_i1.p1  ORF type:complete len:464 (+),score=70.77 TRINITY_DN79989_c0_g1_i1:1-1392(+)
MIFKSVACVSRERIEYEILRCFVVMFFTTVPPSASHLQSGTFVHPAHASYGTTSGGSPQTPTAIGSIVSSSGHHTPVVTRHFMQPVAMPSYQFTPYASLSACFTSRSGVPPTAAAPPSSAFAIPSDTVEIVYIRHGTSLNNTFKEDVLSNTMWISKCVTMGLSKDEHLDSGTRFQRGYVQVCHEDKLGGSYNGSSGSSVAWELSNRSRDSLLHPDGTQEARDVAAELRRALPADLPIERWFVSPLRRTLETTFALLQELGHAGMSTVHQPVCLQPWLHERYMSDSDLALDGHMTARFVARYCKLRPLPPALHHVEANLRDELKLLGDWVHKSGRVDALHADDRFAVEEKSSDDAFPFYPCGPATWIEFQANFQERMTILRRWLLTLQPGRRYFLVGHSQVATALFKDNPEGSHGRLKNLGVVVARFRPEEADPEDPPKFFTGVWQACDRWNCDVPGWRDEDAG